MMKALILAAAFAGYVGGQAAADQPAGQTKVVKTIVRTSDGKGDADAERIVQQCAARKFETVAEISEGGKRRLTKIKLCSTAGESDAVWTRSLEDAKKRIAGDDNISAESKAKIASELDAEIARVHARH